MFNVFVKVQEIKYSWTAALATGYPSTPSLNSEGLEISTNCCENLKHLKSLTEKISEKKYMIILQVIVSFQL